MTWMLIRRSIILREITNHFQLKKQSLSLSTLPPVPLISKIGVQSNDNYKIDIVDHETWQLSTGFSGIWKDATTPYQLPPHDQLVNRKDDQDFDEIDDLRICGKLFYKLDRDSMEYEEYNYDFHKNKSSKSKTKVAKPTENKDKNREIETKRNPRNGEQKCDEMKILEKSLIGKKQRVPTFNQLTGPYHEPFCLDVYISKASVRACIVHRATSNVVAVAHSISKDLKFELGSTRNAAACAAVGKVLAQRALADDIHNVVYTPRKGEKLEGKLLNVVQSVINNGVLVKIKLKKMKVRKLGFQSVNYKLD